jgi:hypothetical protein
MLRFLTCVCITILFSACNNEAKRRQEVSQEILRQSDSVNQTLKNVGVQEEQGNRLVYIACGDEEGASIPPAKEREYALTDDFFLVKKQAADLPGMLNKTKASMVVDVLSPGERKDYLDGMLGSGKAGHDFVRDRFQYLPPEEAETTLFDMVIGVKWLEERILDKYKEKYLKINK